MRFTAVLNKTHIQKWFLKHWKVKRNQLPIESGLEEELKATGIKVMDATDFLLEKPEKPKVEYKKIKINGFYDLPLPKDETHPDFKINAAYELKDKSLLIEGLIQAKVLTNSTEVKAGLPESIETAVEKFQLENSQKFHNSVQSCILNAQLFDAYQEKLPKVKHPEKPMFNFPRSYGVADYRRNRLTTQRLIEFSNLKGLIIRGAKIQTFLQKEQNALVKLETIPSAILCSNSQLNNHIKEVNNVNLMPLPDIFPLSPTISLSTSHFYDDREIFPNLPMGNFINTAIFSFDETKVINIHEEPVTDNQFMGRTLTSTYTVALAAAKHHNHKLPLTIKGLQTDGQRFHFLILQLNSLDANGEKNIFWNSNIMNMFSSCNYEEGIPTLNDYNPNVINTYLAFINSK